MPQKNGPWLINSSEIMYKNPWIEVVEDKVIRPDGKPGIFGTVKMVPGISILPIDNKNNVYLTREFKYALKSETFEVVSGAIDKDETPSRAAKREMAEELGISASSIVQLGIVHPFTSIINSPSYLFLAKDLVFGNAKNEGTEKIRFIKKPMNEVIKMVMDGEIVHGPSAVLILKAARYLGM